MEEGEGDDGGEGGLFIGSNMAGFNGMNRRQSRGGFLPWFDRGDFGWRTMTMTSSSSSAWDPHVCDRKGKKTKEGAGCFRGLELGCESRARAEERKWAWWAGRIGLLGLWPFLFFSNKAFSSFFKTAKQRQLLI